MKKILIVNNNLETGGVQTSLLNLLKELHSSFDVTLLLFHYKPEYEELVPPNVKIISISSAYKHFGMSKKDTVGHPFLFLSRAFWVFLVRTFGRARVVHLMNITQPQINGFDIAISYLHEHSQRLLYGGCNEFVLHKVNAKKKITWLHGDFGLGGSNNKQSRALYKHFDRIVACSEGTKNSIIEFMPQLEDRCLAIRNCNDYEKIIELAGEGVCYDASFFNIVTVARLSKGKSVDRALLAVKHCLDHGYPIRYHIIGDGSEAGKLMQLVQEQNLQDNVIFYGNQRNPYQYMKNADLFLLTSYHEAAPMVFDEAMCLGVPVFATRTLSTDEMIICAGGGFVCDNNQRAIADGLLAILSNPESLEIVKDNLKKKTFSNEMIISEIKTSLLMCDCE